MEGAEEELERRSKYLSSLIRENKKEKGKGTEENDNNSSSNNNKKVRVRGCDMCVSHQNKAFQFAKHFLDNNNTAPDNKRLALLLKKEFDSLYGPAWHCIVGTSFGSYVTHSLGGFLYFSIDKVYILLFKTAVEPMEH